MYMQETVFYTKIPLAWILETLFVLHEVAQVSLQ